MTVHLQGPIRDLVAHWLSRQPLLLPSLPVLGSVIGDVAGTFTAIAKGLSVTLRNLFRKSVTENYPDEPVHFKARYRGIHVLHRDEKGLEKCVACFLCAAACPSHCIYIEAADNTDANRISASDRYATVYNIDYSRCIFCGYCVESCPTDAITHGHGFELAPFNIHSLIYRKEDLLEQKDRPLDSKAAKLKTQRPQT